MTNVQWVLCFGLQNTNEGFLLLGLNAINQNAQPIVPGALILIFQDDYPIPFLLQKSEFLFNSSPTFGYDPQFETRIEASAREKWYKTGVGRDWIKAQL